MTRRAPTALVLAGCALALAGAFGAMVWLGDLFDSARSFVRLFVLASVAYGVAVLWIARRPPKGRAALVGILGAAVAFRLILLPTAPTLSTDVYRYLWDGRLGAAGISPYALPPNAPELAALRDAAVYARLNHPDWRTVYPPGAQLLFAAIARVAPSSALAFKIVMVAFDLLTLALLVGWLSSIGRPRAWALLYAWHPLVVVELAGSGHLDAVALAASVAALWAASRGRETWAGALVGLGALVKLYPVLLLAAILRRQPLRALAVCAAVILAGYGVYAYEGPAAFGALGRYVAEEEFNGSVRAALEVMLAGLGSGGGQVARLVPLVALAGVALGVAVRGRDVPVWRRALWVTGAYLLATPSLFPWYALWIVPIVAVAPAWPWLYLSCAVALTYLIFAEPIWRIPAWVIAAEFAPFALGLALASRPRRDQPARGSVRQSPEAQEA